MTLIIFDCDGTLIDSELLHAQVEVDLIKEKFGIAVTAVEHNRQFCGAGLSEVYAWLEKKTGNLLPPDFEAEISKRKIKAFQKQLRPIPYVMDVLHQLTAIPKCVASNTPLETVQSSLQTTGLYQWFAPHIYTAQMVSHGKPAPDLFLYAARQMNTAPQDCVVIEDSQHGVTAALAANMRIFGFMGGNHCYAGYQEKLRGAEMVFSDMRELPGLLKSG